MKNKLIANARPEPSPHAEALAQKIQEAYDSLCKFDEEEALGNGGDHEDIAEAQNILSNLLSSLPAAQEKK